MSAAGWRITWHWSPPAVRPGRTGPSWKVYPTEAEAQAKAAELRELARGTGATVATSVTQEKSV
jgi:hypothetical protein